jgi:hypothetical protein
MAGGRPTKYSPTLVKKADEYLKISQDEYDEFHKVRSNSEKTADGFDRILKVNLPTVEGFAAFIEVNGDTVVEWAKKYAEFSAALAKIKRVQRERLMNNGLSGNYNSTIAKLILSSNHGMRERQDITSDDKALPTPLLDGIRNNNNNT